MTKQGYIYAVSNPFAPGLLKLGQSVDPWARVERNMSSFVPGRQLIIELTKHFYDVEWRERRLHEILASRRVGGEWFRVDLIEVKDALRCHCGDHLPPAPFVTLGDPNGRHVRITCATDVTPIACEDDCIRVWRP